MGDRPVDPYYEWLGIPPAEQPADFYRLLGITRFEANEKVIERAADRQMGYLRQFQARCPSEAATLLSEVALARITLGDPDKKRLYDSSLRTGSARGGQAPAAATADVRGASWYVQSLGHVHGPIPADELRRRIRSGTASEETLVRRVTDGAWMPVTEARRLLDLAPFRLPTAKPPAPEVTPLPPLERGPDLLSGPLPEPESRPPYPNAWVCPSCRWAVPKAKTHCARCGYVAKVHDSGAADRFAALMVFLLVAAIVAVLVAGTFAP
ncbi:MAG: GYF domain-containing protein [Thermoguttaceae bacterium]